MKKSLKKKSFKKLIVLLLLFIALVLFKQFSHNTTNVDSFVEETFDSLKKFEKEAVDTYITMEKYIDSEEQKGLFENEEMMKIALFENLDYEITSSREINDGLFNATVKVINIDMYDLAENYSEHVKEYILANPDISSEELDKKEKELFLKEFLNPKLNLTETEVAVRIKKTSDGWAVIPSDDIENAVTGGLMKLIDESREQKEEKIEKKDEVDLFFEITYQDEVDEDLDEEATYESEEEEETQE